jgi:hypothetical protein
MLSCRSNISFSRKPVQNTFIESCNGRLRDELLDETLFRSLAHARAGPEAWPRLQCRAPEFEPRLADATGIRGDLSP